MCQLHDDACLMLDELKEIDPKITESVVYMICNGDGQKPHDAPDHGAY